MVRAVSRDLIVMLGVVVGVPLLLYIGRRGRAGDDEDDEDDADDADDAEGSERLRSSPRLCGKSVAVAAVANPRTAGATTSHDCMR
jgi:hypothetical protein